MVYIKKKKKNWIQNPSNSKPGDFPSILYIIIHVLLPCPAFFIFIFHFDRSAYVYNEWVDSVDFVS